MVWHCPGSGSCEQTKSSGSLADCLLSRPSTGHEEGRLFHHCFCFPVFDSDVRPGAVVTFLWPRNKHRVHYTHQNWRAERREKLGSMMTLERHTRNQTVPGSFLHEINDRVKADSAEFSIPCSQKRSRVRQRTTWKSGTLCLLWDHVTPRGSCDPSGIMWLVLGLNSGLLRSFCPLDRGGRESTAPLFTCSLESPSIFMSTHGWHWERQPG